MCTEGRLRRSSPLIRWRVCRAEIVSGGGSWRCLFMGKISVGGAVIQLTLFCVSSDNMHCIVMVLFRHVFRAISCCFAHDPSWLFTLLSDAISHACNFTVSFFGGCKLSSHLAFWSFPQLEPPQLTCGVACLSLRSAA